jgi:hypothetical protein
MQLVSPKPCVNAANKNAPLFLIIFLNPGVSFDFISLSSYQRKRKTEIASMLRVRRGPCRASSGRMGPRAASLSCIPEGYRPSVNLGSALDGPFVGGRVGVEEVGWVRGTGLARLQRGLGHRPYRLGRRTPVLYSRNQSRTNIVPYKEKTGEGRGKLAELLIMVLKTPRGTWIVRGRYWSASRTTGPAGSRSLWS